MQLLLVLLLFVVMQSPAATEGDRNADIWTRMESSGLTGQKMVADEKPFGKGHELIVATTTRDGLAVFIVDQRTHRVDWIVDMQPKGPAFCEAKLEVGPGPRAYVHCFNSYGLYQSSIRYRLDPAAKRTTERMEYQRSGPLIWRGGKWVTYERPEEQTVDLPGGTTVRVDNPDRRGLHVAKNGRGKFYPIPAVSMAEHRKLRAKEPRPLQLGNEIGPMAGDGERIRFAGSFYDGEGSSGVGGLYEFNPATGEYRVERLPEMLDWSGSAIAIDGDRIWIGLNDRTEGYPIAGGLLRYNRVTGERRVYPVKDPVWRIEKMENGVRLATSYGAVELEEESGRMTHYRLEPGAGGRAEVVRSVSVVLGH
jgi:hypothetical protein